MARLAVSVVTCRQAAMRMPLSGWFLMNSLRMLCSTGMDWLAHSMRRLPRSASSIFFTSNAVCVVDIISCFALIFFISKNFAGPLTLITEDLPQRLKPVVSDLFTAGLKPCSTGWLQRVTGSDMGWSVAPARYREVLATCWLLLLSEHR